MSYSKESNRDFALKLLLMTALDVRADRKTNKELLEIIKVLSKEEKI